MGDLVGPNGMYPTYAALVQGADGNFYGTTQEGGIDTLDCGSGCGTIFKILPGNPPSTLYSFSKTDGAYPEGGLVLGADGNFYGTTTAGGDHGKGTVFKITPGGILTPLHSFDGTDGKSPFGSLVQGTDGNFYGTTPSGGFSGSSACSGGCGTVFGITPGGVPTLLYKFHSDDGKAPGPGLVQGADGNFYGTTESGGAHSGIGYCPGGCGTVFKLTPGGVLTPLYSFAGSDGSDPMGALVQAPSGNFFGTTAFGGTSSACPGGCGTFFKITPGGTLTPLHSFDFTDGAEPLGGVVQATDGNFYGTTSGGGLGGGYGNGTVFTMTSKGLLTTLHKYSGSVLPYSGLVQGTDGNFYGTTYEGGHSGFTAWGTVFSLGVGLGPFVKVVPGASDPLSYVTILGNDLSTTTAVTFNGTSAASSIISQYAIQAKVPLFATSGSVQVTTSSGILTSDVPFVVLCELGTCPVILPPPQPRSCAICRRGGE
jgi:uncharacterized repeat protein (TIGR03803 family)